MLHYLVTLDGHDGVAERRFYLSEGGYVSRPTDTPADTFFDARLRNAGSFEAELFGENRTTGSSEVGSGDITIVNQDGALDAWLDYGFDGRAITILALSDLSDPLTGAATVLRGRIDQLDSGNAQREFSVRIYDRRDDLDKPMQVNRYLGTVKSGQDRTADGTVDLKDRVKPVVYGRVFAAPGISVNPFYEVYQWSDGPVASIYVYDAGVPLTLAGDFPTVAALIAATIRPGRFATCLAQGCARLGGAPYKAITADVVEGAVLGDRNAARTVQRLMARMGFVAGTDIDVASFDRLAAAAPAEVGIHVVEERTGLAVAQSLLGSIGGWIVPGPLGVFEVGRLESPGAPIDTLDEDDILGPSDIQWLTTQDDNGGVPPYRVIVRYQPIGLVQGTGDVAACVDKDYRDFLGRAYRETKAEDPTILVKHRKAGETVRETLLTQIAEAEAEARRLLALYGVRRDRIKVRITAERALGLGRGMTIAVRLSRFGYAAGRPMVILGRKDDFATQDVTLNLWG